MRPKRVKRRRWAPHRPRPRRPIHEVQGWGIFNRYNGKFSIGIDNLNGLKQINDRFGHVVGSQALCRLADVLDNSSRDLDTAARFGGDEFAVVLPETGAEAASLVGRRICDSLANDGKEPKLSVSVGVAIYPKDGETIDALVSAADSAVYAMKARARGAGTSFRQLSHKAAAGINRVYL